MALVERGYRDGGDGGSDDRVYISVSREAVVAPPVITDFSGRPWEEQYMRVLEGYYAAVAGVALGGCGGGREGTCRGSGGRCAERVRVPRGALRFEVGDGGSGGGGVVSWAESEEREPELCVDGGSAARSAVAEGGGESGGASVDVAGEVDPLAGLAGRRRRKKKRALKAEVKRRLAPGLGSAEVKQVSLAEVPTGAEAPQVEVADSKVPEWRRKKSAAPVHRGYFADCSDEVQRQLKESRARMLVAKNNETALRAEAAVKSRLVEQSAELRRLQTEARLKKALESKFGVGMKSGFAETVISQGLEEVCGTPSLSDGSVSPNSSISVCMVRKMEQTIKDLTEKLKDIQLKYDVLSGAVKKGCAGKEKSDEDYDGPISEAEYRRNCDIMYGMRPGATKPMDAKYDELMVKMCAEGFSALGTEDLNELQAYGEFYG